MFKRIFNLGAGPPRWPGIQHTQDIYLAATETTTLKENENGH